MTLEKILCVQRGKGIHSREQIHNVPGIGSLCLNGKKKKSKQSVAMIQHPISKSLQWCSRSEELTSKPQSFTND